MAPFPRPFVTELFESIPATCRDVACHGADLPNGWTAQTKGRVIMVVPNIRCVIVTDKKPGRPCALLNASQATAPDLARVALPDSGERRSRSGDLYN